MAFLWCGFDSKEKCFPPPSTSSQLLSPALLNILEGTLERHFSRSFSCNLSACVWGCARTWEPLWYPERETQACGVETRLPVSDALPAISAFPRSPRLVRLPVRSDMAGARTHELACFSERIVLIWNWQRSRKYFPNWGWLMGWEGGEVGGGGGEAGSWVRDGERNRSEERNKTLWWVRGYRYREVEKGKDLLNW